MRTLIDRAKAWGEQIGALILSNNTSSRWVVRELLATELADICITTLMSVHDLHFHILCHVVVVHYSTR
jgi:hypothetical protein